MSTNMKRVFKWIVTILGYVGIIAILDGILGIGLKDKWDDFVDWAKK